LLLKQHLNNSSLECFALLKTRKFILGDDFSLLDVAIAPLLWRLEYYGIELGKSSPAIMKYKERIFQRESFVESLTPAEKAMRK